MNKQQRLRKRSPRSLFEMKPYLDRINDLVETPEYIEKDPVRFIHIFHDKRDIEIAGFFAAIMAWGRRDIVVAKVDDLLHRMDMKPFRFVMNYSTKDYDRFSSFRHRTFKPADIHSILSALQQIYAYYHDFEAYWKKCYQNGSELHRPFLAVFHEEFFTMSDDFEYRTRKHISNPENGSTCKRLYMFLRWMIRKDSPVDSGIWNFMPASQLRIPFDVHVARQARKYGLLSRRTNDWKTVNELTDTLKLLNPEDPARYDYALFGIGALGYTIPDRFILNRI